MMLLAIVTGLIVHKRIFKDFFTFRPNKGTRSWLDAHHAFGIMALPFLLMIIYTGLSARMWDYIPAPDVAIPDVERASEFPPPVARPAIPIAEIVARAEEILGKGEIGEIDINRSGERLQLRVQRHWGTQYPFFTEGENDLFFDGETGERLYNADTRGQAPAWKALWYLTGLHYAWFAGANLRWLYFISGLVGCALIASGLVIWTTRRRARHEKEAMETGQPAFGFRLVEKLNIATIAALPVGIAAYFWANRLLPFTMAHRAEWEVHTLFFIWGRLAYYALLRPAKRAWTELFALTAAAFALLPVLNALTTDKHLASTMAHGDWALAGVDLTFLAFGAGFGVMAWVSEDRRRRMEDRRSAAASPPKEQAAAAGAALTRSAS